MIDDFCNPCEQKKKHESLRERERKKRVGGEGGISKWMMGLGFL
jgi:hypothetical protein